MNKKKALSIAVLELKNIKAAYITAACLIIIGMWTLIQCLTGLSGNIYIDTANYLYVFAVLSPILISSYCMKRVLYLNGSKKMFFKGTLLAYLIAALSFSVLNLLIFSLTDVIFGNSVSIINLSSVFGWRENGLIVCLIQQFSFFLFAECFFHTLTCAHFRKYGIAADIILAAILAIFIPVKQFRKYLTAFFDLIIFADNAAIQIISCLLLSALFYLMSINIIRRRKI
jgi:hypothetical protein